VVEWRVPSQKKKGVKPNWDLHDALLIKLSGEYAIVMCIVCCAEITIPRHTIICCVTWPPENRGSVSVRFLLKTAVFGFGLKTVTALVIYRLNCPVRAPGL